MKGRRPPRDGQLEEVGTSYIFFWSDRPKAERRDAGVAFAIRNDIVGRLPCLPQGSTLSRNTRIDDEVAQRISKASQAFGRLKDCVAENWSVYSNQARKLNDFHLSRLRIILKTRWQENIPDTEVLERTGTLSIHAMLKHMQLRWSGQRVRMDDERLPKRLFYGDVATVARQQGGQK
ncbi:unnamed protein product [Schistocephalus solidus]|uniref:Transposase n=1 Tax=Schistocephalus solidus TaxID=70667 RepID=A0A183TB20_SCHSO|nr:unnamed protein product [Schistocephalus solidus]